MENKLSYKMILPAGHFIVNPDDDNIDINVVLQTGEVFFVVLYTINNVLRHSQQSDEIVFWESDMLIVKNLNKSSVVHAIDYLLKNNILEQHFSKIGTIKTVYGEDITYENIGNTDYPFTLDCENFFA